MNGTGCRHDSCNRGREPRVFCPVASEGLRVEGEHPTNIGGKWKGPDKTLAENRSRHTSEPCHDQVARTRKPRPWLPSAWLSRAAGKERTAHHATLKSRTPQWLPWLPWLTAANVGRKTRCSLTLVGSRHLPMQLVRRVPRRRMMLARRGGFVGSQPPLTSSAIRTTHKRWDGDC